MNYIMTPIDIEMLLHCYYMPISWVESGKRASISAQMSLDKLIKLKLIETGTLKQSTTVTSAGHAYVKAICNVPLPS